MFILNLKIKKFLKIEWGDEMTPEEQIQEEILAVCKQICSFSANPHEWSVREATAAKIQELLKCKYDVVLKDRLRECGAIEFKKDVKKILFSMDPSMPPAFNYGQAEFWFYVISQNLDIKLKAEYATQSKGSD